jgi:hypothetical protein
MNKANYAEAQKHMLSQKKFTDFISESVQLITKKCQEGTPYLKIEKEYIERVSVLNLSRLESFILIVSIRDILEDGVKEVSPCIDSFIDGIFTSHTGNCAFSELLRFKNEPLEAVELGQYVDNKTWMTDTSWKDHILSTGRGV